MNNNINNRNNRIIAVINLINNKCKIYKRFQ